MQYHHIRHATGMLYYADFALLIDPMLSEAKANPPIQQSWNSRRNPLVPLPIKIESLPIPTHCLVTHLHRDHFDIAAEAYLPKQLPLICQPSDASAFSAMGFSTVFQVESTFNIPHTRVTVKRVPGRHGTGAIAERMGISSGYLFKAKGEPTLYITGDTVFYEAVEKTLLDEKPQIIIAFGGAAQFSEGDPITLTPEDLLSIHRTVPDATIICTHMEALNHCRTTRADLRAFLREAYNDSAAFVIPEDGTKLDFNL